MTDTKKQKLLRLAPDLMDQVQELKDAGESDNAVYTRVLEAGISSLTGEPSCEAVRGDISPDNERPVEEEAPAAIEAQNVAISTLQRYAATLEQQLAIKDEQLAKANERLAEAHELAQPKQLAPVTTDAAPLSERLAFLFTGKKNHLE